MDLSKKLTEEEVTLRKELVELEERINLKIRRIGLTHHKLPYERLAKGLRLEELVHFNYRIFGFGEESGFRDLSG